MTTPNQWSLRFLTIITVALAACWTPPAIAQRVTGIDVSAWQGNITQANWNTLKRATDQQVGGIFGDGQTFAFIRSSRGGTTGYYNQNDSDNSDGLNMLSQRYDDPYFVQNITRATTAGLFAGGYHFSRPDIIASTLNANGIANTGADEADHFMQMEGAWMRPGYLMPVHDLEAGSGIRTASQLAQFAIDFSNRIYEVKGFRPAIYTGGSYSSSMNSIPESAAVVAAYPVLWTPRWPNQANPSAIDIQNTDPGDYTPTIYGPWDNAPNPADPWHFWQYASTGRMNGIGNGTANVDVDVAHGGVEFVKDHLVPALWTTDSSGDWSTLANWNSGQAPVAPVQGPGQVARVGALTLPTPRLPGAAGTAVTDGLNDTVILERANANVTVTLSSGAANIRKLYAREALNITGGSLNINYVPSADSTPISAQFSAPVALSGAGSLNVHTLQVDASQTFTLGGGSLTLNKINLMPGATPASILVSGNVNLNPLADAAAIIGNGAGAGSTGFVNLGGGTRSLNIGNGASAVDLSINVPVTNGGLTKLGAGTLALNGANNYPGNTTIQAGTLRLGTATLADFSDIYLSTGGLLDLSFSGAADNVHGLFFDGAPQAAGVWGAVGSGAQFTSPFLTGTGLLSVAIVAPPLPPVPAGNVIDDFEVDEGHFGSAYNFSPVSQTFGLAGTTTIDRTTAEHQGKTGSASQLVNLEVDATGDAAWQIRHNSGIGQIAQPGGNTPLPGTGYVGFWLKTDDPSAVVRIAIDDPLGANTTALERSIAKDVIADNQWHLYQWNLQDADAWDIFAGGADGDIDAASGFVTIDSIWLAGTGNTQIYLDNVMHNPNGLITPGYIPGDFDGDGLVNAVDYATWRTTFGQIVTPWTSADGNGDGQIDMADYIAWRKAMSTGGGASLGANNTAVPEPTTVVLAAIAAVFLIGRRKPLAA